MLLARLLRRLIKVGHLTVIDATGDKHEFGKTDGAPRATIRLHEKALHGRNTDARGWNSRWVL
jgi:hypothetical protein